MKGERRRLGSPLSPLGGKRVFSSGSSRRCVRSSDRKSLEDFWLLFRARGGGWLGGGGLVRLA